jgi:hypothetical protein
MSNPTPSQLTNTELTEELARLARSGRDTTVCLVTHLAEFEARDLHLAAGFPSLFAYCTEVLRLSEHEAYHRILAARTARRYPRILAMLREGRLNLTTVRLIAPLLTEANAGQVLDEAAGLSKRRVEELVARHAPQPDVPRPCATGETAAAPPPTAVTSSFGRRPVAPAPGAPAVVTGRPPSARPDATRSASPPARRRARSSNARRICCVMPSPAATPPRSWTGR